MSTLEIEVEDEILERLDRVGADRTAERSEFIASAIRKALWEREEQLTARAYAAQPDSEEPDVDPAVWEPRGS